MTLQFSSCAVAEENCADIIAGHFSSPAYRDRGREDMSFIYEAWSGTLLISPPGKIQMWGQMCEDCCGFVLTKKSESFWKEVSHGSFDLNEDKLQLKKGGNTAHLTVYVHFFAAGVPKTCCRSKQGDKGNNVCETNTFVIHFTFLLKEPMIFQKKIYRLLLKTTVVRCPVLKVVLLWVSLFATCARNWCKRSICADCRPTV